LLTGKGWSGALTNSQVLTPGSGVGSALELPHAVKTLMQSNRIRNIHIFVACIFSGILGYSKLRFWFK
jgi:hypothetical protein